MLGAVDGTYSTSTRGLCGQSFNRELHVGKGSRQQQCALACHSGQPRLNSYRTTDFRKLTSAVCALTARKGLIISKGCGVLPWPQKVLNHCTENTRCHSLLQTIFKFPQALSISWKDLQERS